MNNNSNIKSSLLITSPILLYFLLSLVANIGTAFLYPYKFDLDFLKFFLVVYPVCNLVVYTFLRLSTSPNTILKTSLGLLYSLITSYLVVFKLAIGSYYYSYPGGGGLEFLAVIFSWPLLFIVSIPCLLLVLKNTKSILIYLSLIPFVAGFIVLGLLTFTGRQIFASTYKSRNGQLKTQVSFIPKSITYLGNINDQNCNCTRPQFTSEVDVTSRINFPIVISGSLTQDQSGCKINGDFQPLIAQGTHSLSITCFINTPAISPTTINNLSLKIRLQEKDNQEVTLDTTYPFSSFPTRLGY